MSKQTHRELSRAINAFLATYEADKVPHGFLTIAEWSSLFKVNTRQAWNNIERIIKAGHAERAIYRVKAQTVIRPVPHYRLSKEALKALGLTLPKR